VPPCLKGTANRDLVFSPISSPDVEIDTSMSCERAEEPAKVTNLILRNSSKLRAAFSKHLDLRAVFSEGQALPRWPKSVWEGLKSAESS